MTALELTKRGLQWTRDEHASLVSVHGPESLCAIAKREVAARVDRMRSIVPLFPDSAGVCTACGNSLGREGRGGWCELCTLARRVALKQAGVAL